MRWLFACAVAIVAAGAGGLVYLSQRGAASPPQERFTAVMTWKSGQRPAPDFALRDQNGRPISMASLRGRPVVVTFMDPVCQTLCPLEARVLSAATRDLPPADRPTIVSVSVNPPADTAANFAADRRKWVLGSNWRWATGTHRQLARVWRDWEIAVRVTKSDVVHTEASFVVDRNGDERAVYIYPFKGADLAQTVRDVAGS